MSKKKNRDADKTRMSFIKAASVLFAKNGYNGTSNKMLAEYAGLNAALISYHFDGKLGLYRETVISLVKEAIPFLAPLNSLRGEIKHDMGLLIDCFFMALSNHQELAAILLHEHLDGGARLQDAYSEHVSQFYLSTQKVLRACYPIESRPDSHATHLSLIGAITFYLVSQAYRDEAKKQKTQIAPLVQHKDYIDSLKNLYAREVNTN